MNARERLEVQVGCAVNTNAALVPTFTPYLVRLHRFFVPLQLYHPEMRVNAANFDMRNLSFNALSISAAMAAPTTGMGASGAVLPYQGLFKVDPCSCLSFLRLLSGAQYRTSWQTFPSYINTAASQQPVRFYSSVPTAGDYINCDALLGYWDVVRNYYSFSQTNDFSLAFPGNFVPNVPSQAQSSFGYTNARWTQYYGRLSYLDDFFETSFYSQPGESRFYDRASLFLALSNSLAVGAAQNTQYSYPSFYTQSRTVTASDAEESWTTTMYSYFLRNSPLAVVPSNPDRFSRMLPTSAYTQNNISLSGVSNIRELAVASRLQEYLDLLGAGGSRFSDWLQTFFASKIRHVDRPTLLHSSSFYMNSSPIYNQSGEAGGGSAGTDTVLGAYAGAINGQADFGKRKQVYHFDEPGYVMDMFSIVPQYYWAGIQEDYATYDANDYFNPIFNQIGYQSVPRHRFGPFSFNAGASAPMQVINAEPCFNEFRASYDEVLGDFAYIPGLNYDRQPNQILSTWVMQRAFIDSSNILQFSTAPFRYVDIDTVNAPFASFAEDNFFVNLYYNVTRKSLVSKQFATKLSTR